MTRSTSEVPCPSSGADSVLLLPKKAVPPGPYDDKALPALTRKELALALMALRRSLPDRACIAAVSQNRLAQSGTRALATLRNSLRKDHVQSFPSRCDTPTVIALAQALRDSGFSTISVYSLQGDPLAPGRIALAYPVGIGGSGPARLIEWMRETSQAALAPAFLVTAHTGERDTYSFLPRLLSALNAQGDRDRDHDPVATNSRIVRVVSSGKQKSVVFVRGERSELVIRVPHSSKAEQSEARAYAILQMLSAGRSVTGLAPQPVKSIHIGGRNAFVESRLRGLPLARCLNRSNRRSYAKPVSALLRCLNPDLPQTRLTAFDENMMASFVRPAIDRVLGRVADAKVRSTAFRAIESALTGCASRLGIVHGDFSVNNILVRSSYTVSGVIDWEDALAAGPPVLDALNYLDSVHRYCEPSHALADTIAMLANGSWPVPEEFDLLRQSFADCGIDFAYLRGFTLLYWLFHVGPQLDYGLAPSSFDRRVSEVLRRVLT